MEQFSSTSNLAIPVIPKTEATKKKYGRLRDEFGKRTYEELPSLLLQHFKKHKNADNLMTWEEINQPIKTIKKCQNQLVSTSVILNEVCGAAALVW